MQATLIPIADRHVDYAYEVRAEAARAGLRVEVDARTERMGAKIRDAQLQKVPYMLIAGDREAEAQAVGVRTRVGRRPRRGARGRARRRGWSRSETRALRLVIRVRANVRYGKRTSMLSRATMPPSRGLSK